ncbi:MAG: hypothetical protein E7388_02305 [Ruminococcaceae bacterium]|nr:hypothetical protein [Oscillospiraceae bacterium]
MKDRWELRKNEIVWKVKEGAHVDNIEMAGRKMATVVYYGVDEEGKLDLKKRVFYPTLRMIPNHTHASCAREYSKEEYLKFAIMGNEIKEMPYEVRISGMLTIYSRDSERKLKITRMIFPSIDKMAYIEHTTVQNISNDIQVVSCNMFSNTVYERGTKGVYALEVDTKGPQTVTLKVGETVSYDTVFTARKLVEKRPEVNGVKEMTRRKEFVNDIFTKSLVLESEDPILDCEFNFSKLRITESIFDTMHGPMHGPGGQAYYAAIWANDEAEYAAPYFGFAGNDYADEATINVMKLYRPFMHPEMYHIPASIISEGNDIWEAPGDLGDASMYLYGMTRFLLQKGDIELAKEYFDTIDWCVRFAATKENEHHVIESDADELENRLPSGNANLLNNSLTYGGLMGAYYIAKDLGLEEKAAEYRDFAARVREGIENHFGGEIDGYHTYMYFNGCDVLRSYMCAPLTVGIYDRKEGTANALLEKLWTENGLLSAQDNEMFWDRSTLYALRGIFSAGMCEKGYKHLNEYNHQRLLGDHVPYPIEAWPEGNQRHLSAEGGLYARIIIEGMFGINPTGFRSFTIAPSIPARQGRMALRRIKAFGGCFDVEIERSGKKYEVKVVNADGVEQNFIVPLEGSIEVTI